MAKLPQSVKVACYSILERLNLFFAILAPAIIQHFNLTINYLGIFFCLQEGCKSLSEHMTRWMVQKFTFYYTVALGIALRIIAFTMCANCSSKSAFLLTAVMYGVSRSMASSKLEAFLITHGNHNNSSNKTSQTFSLRYISSNVGATLSGLIAALILKSLSIAAVFYAASTITGMQLIFFLLFWSETKITQSNPSKAKQWRFSLQVYWLQLVMAFFVIVCKSMYKISIAQNVNAQYFVFIYSAVQFSTIVVPMSIMLLPANIKRLIVPTGFIVMVLSLAMYAARFTYAYLFLLVFAAIYPSIRGEVAKLIVTSGDSQAKTMQKITNTESMTSLLSAIFYMMVFVFG